MKGKVVIILVVTSVIVSAMLLGYKYNDTITPIDTLSKSLSTTSKVIPNGSTIGYKSFPNDLELFGKARYVLAPTNIVLLGENTKLDTILSIHNLSNSDSSLQVFLKNRVIIHQHTDSIYKYYISINK